MTDEKLQNAIALQEDIQTTLKEICEVESWLRAAKNENLLVSISADEGFRRSIEPSESQLDDVVKTIENRFYDAVKLHLADLNEDLDALKKQFEEL